MDKDLQRVREEREELVDTQKIFIKILAAFYAEDAVDYEALGMEVDEGAVEFKDVYINVNNIVSVSPNKAGGVNICTYDGDRWSTGKDSSIRIAKFLNNLSVDLTNG